MNPFSSTYPPRSGSTTRNDIRSRPETTLRLPCPRHPDWIIMLNEVKRPADERKGALFCYLTQILRYRSG